MFDCQICINEDANARKFSSLDQLEAHLAADHFSLLPYECEHCQFAKFPTEFAVMKHNEMDHDSQSYSFRCRITPEIKEKRLKVREFLLTVADKDSTSKGSERKSLPDSSEVEVGKKRKAQNGQPKNDQGKVSDGEEEPRERPKRLCLRPRPFSFGHNTETGERMENDGNAAVFLAIGGEEKDDDAEGSSLTNEMKEQQANVQEILRATAAAVSQLGGPKKRCNGQTTTNGLPSENYSLRPNRFKPYALLHQGIPIPTENDVVHHHIVENLTETENPPSPSKNKRKRNKGKAICRIRCKKCKEMVNAQGGCLLHHTNARHLHLAMFHCKLCKKDFFEVSNTRIIRHMNELHKGNTKSLVSNYHKFSAVLHATRDECFGEKEERIRMQQNENDKTNTKILMPFKHSAKSQRRSQLSKEQNLAKDHQQQNGDEQRVPCKICEEMVWNKRVNRLNHVNVRHFQHPLHECAICHKTFTSYTRAACYSHIQNAHKAELGSGQCSNAIDEHIIYRKEIYDEQLIEALKDHF